MNYIQEINSFYNYIVENPLTCCEQALWHRLMSYCNSFNWKSDFTLTNSRLVEDLQISRQHLDRARNTLVQVGLISYKKGTGNQCGTYHLNSLSVIFVTQHDTQCGHTMIHSAVTKRAQHDTQCGHTMIPLDKLNKTKLNETKLTTSNKKTVEICEPVILKTAIGVVVNCYEENIGVVAKAVYDDISTLIDNGMESDLLCECIKISAFNNKPQWSYVKGIIKNLICRDIKTLTEFNACNNKKSKSSETSSYDIDGLDEFWNTVPKLL